MIHYGLHRHFTGSGSVLMFGGGMKKGFLYGETAAERPLVDDEEPGQHPRPARDDLHGDGHLAEDGVRRREAAVLRDRGRQGRAGDGPVREGVIVRPKVSPPGAEVHGEEKAAGGVLHHAYTNLPVRPV